MRGYVAAVPRRSEGRVGVRVETRDGRLLVERAGAGRRARRRRGHRGARCDLGPAPEWQRDLPRAPRDRARSSRRATIERASAHAAAASAGRSTASARAPRRRWPRVPPDASADLLRGFVLGQDDRIDDATVERLQALRPRAPARRQRPERRPARDPRRRGAARCSGVPLRARLVAIGSADRASTCRSPGAGPSIQRAGVMGAAGIVAALAGRPRVALVRAPARRRGDPGAQPARRRRRRLAAQLRRGRSGSCCSARPLAAAARGPRAGRAAAGRSPRARR